MLFGVLSMIVALIINVWLWGHWSFEQTAGMTLLLVLNSLLLITIAVIPVIKFFKEKNFHKAYKNWTIKILFYSIVLLTVFLCVTHFQGWIKILLPIKLALVIVTTFIRFKRKKLFFQKN